MSFLRVKVFVNYFLSQLLCLISEPPEKTSDKIGGKIFKFSFSRAKFLGFPPPVLKVTSPLKTCLWQNHTAHLHNPHCNLKCSHRKRIPLTFCLTELQPPSEGWILYTISGQGSSRHRAGVSLRDNCSLED